MEGIVNMENNSVNLIGVVKRDAVAGSGTLDFCIEVTNEKGRHDFFDCRTTQQSAAYQQLEGFVNGGERLEVMGHLEKMTRTESQRLAGVLVEVKTTMTVIYVDSVIEEDE